MKSKPIPTSPKNHPDHKKLSPRDNKLSKAYWQSLEKPKKRGRVFLVSLIVSLVFGFMAGFLASVSSNNLIENYLSKLPYIGDSFKSNQTVSGQIIIKESSVESSSKQVLIDSILDNNKNAVVGIFSKKYISSKNIKNFYMQSDKISNGLVVTADGYIVIPEDAVKNKIDYVVIANNGEIFDISGHWLDPSSDLSIIKIEATNLPSVNFISKNEINIAEEVAVLSNDIYGWSNLSLNNLETLDLDKSILDNGPIKSSDTLTDYYTLTNKISVAYNGSAVFNLNGEVVGMAIKDSGREISLIFPGEYIDQMTKKLLENNEIARTYLGINYINIDQSVGLTDELTQGQNRGALVYQNSVNGQPGVIASSPAKLSGILEEDIILKINDLEINKTNDISQIIQKFKPGNIISFVIYRNNIEKEISVELGEK